MLEISNARKTFFKGMPDEKVALDGLSLKLNRGDFVVVIGSNGAGKSTMMNAISGALLVDSGRIVINGDDVTTMPVHARARHVARVFQDPMKGTAASMTIAENMLLADLRQNPARLRRGLTPQRREKYREHLSYLGLGLENRLDTRFRCCRAASGNPCHWSWPSVANPTSCFSMSIRRRLIRAPPIWC